MQLLAWISFLLGLLAVGHAGKVEKNENVCTVKANGGQQDDVPNLLEAFEQCGNGGTIIFPEDQTYWIATRLHPTLNDVAIEWRGKWTVKSLVVHSPSADLLTGC